MQNARSRHFLHLVRWLGERYGKRGGVRFGKVLAIATAGFQGLLLVLLSFGSATVDPFGYTTSTLVFVSFVAGTATSLSLAADLAQGDERDGIQLLARLAGHSPQQIAWARFAASFAILGRLVLLPGAAVTVLGLSLVRTPEQLLGFATTLGFTLVYALAFGVVVGALCRLAPAIAPAGGRTALLGLVVAPELLHVLWPSVPTPVRSLSWLLDIVHRAAGAFT